MVIAMTEFEYYMIKDFGEQFKNVILISGNKFPFVSIDSASEQISFSKNKRLMRSEDKNQYDDNTDLSLISKLAFKFMTKKKLFLLINSHFMEKNKKRKQEQSEKIKNELSKNLLWSDIPLYTFKYIYKNTKMFKKDSILKMDLYIENSLQYIIENKNGLFNFIIESKKEELKKDNQSCEQLLKILYTFYAVNSYNDFDKNPQLILTDNQLLGTLELISEIYSFDKIKDCHRKLSIDGTNHIYDVALRATNKLGGRRNNQEKINNFFRMLEVFIEKKHLYKIIESDNNQAQEKVAKKRL